MKSNRGIILIAGGHPYYGKMAAALAASIRYCDKEIPIILFTAGDAKNYLKQSELRLFTEVRDLPTETFLHDGVRKYMRSKTHLYDLSPFNETLFLDVDMIWHHKRPVQDLFNSLSDVAFTMINEGHVDLSTGADNGNPTYTFWAKLDDIKSVYGNRGEFLKNKLYKLRSELIYFKKGATIRKYFNLAKRIYDNPGVKFMEMGFGLPDEFAFNVAGCIMEFYPHQDKYCPVYWQYIHRNFMERPEIFKKFFATSIGGNKSFTNQKSIYNDLATFYYNALRLSSPYQLKEKRDYLPERINI